MERSVEEGCATAPSAVMAGRGRCEKTDVAHLALGGMHDEPAWRSDHSGRPALRRPSKKCSTSSGRLNNASRLWVPANVYFGSIRKTSAASARASSSCPNCARLAAKELQTPVEGPRNSDARRPQTYPRHLGQSPTADVRSNLSLEIHGGRVAAADEHGDALPRRGLVTPRN